MDRVGTVGAAPDKVAPGPEENSLLVTESCFAGWIPANNVRHRAQRGSLVGWGSYRDHGRGTVPFCILVTTPSVNMDPAHVPWGRKNLWLGRGWVNLENYK